MRDVDGIKPGGFLTGNIWRRPIQYRLSEVEVLYTSLALLAQKFLFRPAQSTA